MSRLSLTSGAPR
ncbi:hypothetical protein BIW11_07223 [Tropilaelaps mercedesae]|uniref:Uncharacterized protein n=1 Tax=Tropilaelaps mercedesae TaxID=418985 RepID=A0A1V9XV66_9ACAR|nr:hypothetical protein BIW11_07223 [Tropilaelaps mercedesae]